MNFDPKFFLFKMIVTQEVRMETGVADSIDDIALIDSAVEKLLQRIMAGIRIKLRRYFRRWRNARKKI